MGDNKNNINISIDIDSEKPNLIALEITKSILSNALFRYKDDTKKATSIFLGVYAKVLSEIKYFENNPKAYNELLKTTFESLK